MVRGNKSPPCGMRLLRSETKLKARRLTKLLEYFFCERQKKKKFEQLKNSKKVFFKLIISISLKYIFFCCINRNLLICFHAKLLGCFFISFMGEMNSVCDEKYRPSVMRI